VEWFLAGSDGLGFGVGVFVVLSDWLRCFYHLASLCFPR
jgi:hypothetical protein